MNVTFKNDTVFNEQWTIKDGVTGQVIFDGPLASKGSPGDSVELSLSASSGGYGEAYYKHSGQSIFTHKSFIENGDTVYMF